MKAFKEWYTKEKTQDVLNEFYDYMDVAEESWKAALKKIKEKCDFLNNHCKTHFDMWVKLKGFIREELNAK